MTTKEMVIPTQDGKPVLMHTHQRESRSRPWLTHVLLCMGKLGPIDALQVSKN